MKKLLGFTLAEILIVLVVLGVMAAILLPAMRKTTPDENLLKFKNTHKAFTDTIREMIVSDKYYINSDFNYDVNGNFLRSSVSTYFCNAFVDIIAPKQYSCNASKNAEGEAISLSTLNTKKASLDNDCKTKYYTVSAKNTYTLANGAFVYHFNSDWPTDKDSNDIPTSYHLFCVDVDGIPSGASKDNCVNECPFGYAIRLDGKVITSTKVDEWLEKTSNNN